MTVWLLFGQIKAKTREAGSDTVAGWKLCDANWAEFSQKHLGPLRPISLEILRPDNWMRLYTSPSYSFLVTVQIVTSWLWSSPQSAFYLLHWDTRIKGWHPSYIHHSTYTVPMGPWGVGKKFCLHPFLQGLGLLRWRLLFEEVSPGISAGFGSQSPPHAPPWQIEISPPSSFLFCHHIRPCFYPGLLPFL